MQQYLKSITEEVYWFTTNQSLQPQKVIGLSLNEISLCPYNVLRVFFVNLKYQLSDKNDFNADYHHITKDLYRTHQILKKFQI